jgi:hypothetical protein
MTGVKISKNVELRPVRDKDTGWWKLCMVVETEFLPQVFTSSILVQTVEEAMDMLVDVQNAMNVK